MSVSQFPSTEMQTQPLGSWFASCDKENISAKRLRYSRLRLGSNSASRSEGPADSLSLESLISTVDTSVCVSARGSGIEF